jgi:hypothetical protein
MAFARLIHTAIFRRKLAFLPARLQEFTKLTTGSKMQTYFGNP